MHLHPYLLELKVRALNFTYFIINSNFPTFFQVFITFILIIFE